MALMGLLGLFVTYFGVGIAILVAVRHRRPSDAGDEQRRATGLVVVGLALLVVLSIGIGVYFAA